jgi:hypothetical protein
MSVVQGSGKQTLSLKLGDTYIQYEVWIEYDDGSSKCIDVYTNPKGAHGQLKKTLHKCLFSYYHELAFVPYPNRPVYPNPKPLRAYLKKIECVVTSETTIKDWEWDQAHDGVIKDLTKKNYSGESHADMFGLDMSRIPPKP